MSVRASLLRFPVDAEAQESCGIPWGVAVTPFSSGDEHGVSPAYGSDGHLLPRCENCWAYFNSYCELEQWAWTCSLCGSLNGLPSHAIHRYSQSQACAEMSSSFIDLELPAEESAEAMQARPVYVAAVDVASSEDFLELVKSSLLAALEALGPGSLFGLVTFSHKIGVYDVQGPIPVVKNVFIPPEEEGRLPISLEDVMPLLSFLAPVETCKDRIAAALETLKPTTSWERTTAAGQGIDGVLFGGRGFGIAMDALISYLSSEYGNTFALARVFAFLSGPPDYGAGQLDTRRYGEQYASRKEDADLALLPEQTPFYKDLAAIAVQAGVCVDLFAITNEYTDLASLKFLSIESGGSLFLYSNTDDSTLPQDMYRMLSRPYAFGCVLRLRTSSEFKLGRSYGHFFPDPQYENVQHIICCDSFATYAYDFEFVNSSGFSSLQVHQIKQFLHGIRAVAKRHSASMESSSTTGGEEQSSNRFKMEDITIPPQLKFLMSNIKSVVNLQLTPENYPIWKAQVYKLFKANGCEGYLDGSNPKPPRQMVSSDGAITQNPQAITWMLVDQNLAAALYSTISTSLLPYVLNLESCTEIWKTIERRLQSTNRSKLIQLKNELYHVSMKDKSMVQYLSEIKTKLDAIAAASSPIDAEDIIQYTLNGLPSSYQAFKTAIRTNLQPISLDDFYSLLCSEELNLATEALKEISLHSTPDPHLALASNRGRGVYTSPRGRHAYNTANRSRGTQF